VSWVAVMLAGIGVAGAQEDATPTLATYMDAAVLNNPRSAIAAATVDTARADVTEAGGFLLPNVRATGSYTRNQFEAIANYPVAGGGPPQEIVIFPRDQLTATITASVPLIDGPGFAQWQAARDGADAAEYDEVAVANDLRLEVARAWYVAVAAQEVVFAAQRARAAADENLRMVQIRAAAGAATNLSVHRAELEVANAQQLAIDAERVRRVSLRTLATLSGLPEPESLPVVPATAPVQMSEEDAVAIADSARPELAAAEARVEQLRLVRSGAWLGYTPTLSGFATEEYTNASGFSGEEAFWTLGVQADWLLLDFGDRGADVKRARAALATAEATLQETQDRVRDEVHAAWLDVEAAVASVEAARRGATVSREAAREFTTRFQVGMSTQFDVIQADRDALDAEVARIRAEGELQIAVLALQRATGQPIQP